MPGRAPAAPTDAVTVFDGIAAQSPGATYAQGCTLSHLEPPDVRPGAGLRHRRGLRGSGAAAQAADQVVLALGETREMSGEAAVAQRDRPARAASRS